MFTRFCQTTWRYSRDFLLQAHSFLYVLLWRLKFQVFLSPLSLYGNRPCYVNVDVSIVILGVLGSKVQNLLQFFVMHQKYIRSNLKKNTEERKKIITKKERKKTWNIKRILACSTDETFVIIGRNNPHTVTRSKV